MEIKREGVRVYRGRRRVREKEGALMNQMMQQQGPSVPRDGPIKLRKHEREREKERKKERKKERE